MLNLFKKSAETTLREAREFLQFGRSKDTPTKQDAEGNITHRCPETAMASVHRGNPKAWRFIRAAITPISNAANRVNGIGVLGLVNKQPDVTDEVLLAAFREAEAAARAAGV